MKISQKSWHYRLIRFTGDWPEENLCPYMRQVLGRLAIIPLALFLMTIVVALLTFPLWQWFVDMDAGNALTLGVGSFMGNSMILGLLLAEYRKDWRWHNDHPSYDAWYHRDIFGWLLPKLPERKARVQKPPSAFAEWRRATHDQICPSIDFKE